MTEHDKDMIIKLRMSGVGYRTIANKLDLSRDTVRGFCKRRGVDGVAEAAKLNYEMSLVNGLVCLNCGLKIKQSKKGRRKKFCSDKCRVSWWTKNYAMHNFGLKSMHKLVCIGCGKKFLSYSNAKRKYCTHECYIKSRFGGK